MQQNFCTYSIISQHPHCTQVKNSFVNERIVYKFKTCDTFGCMRAAKTSLSLPERL